MAERQTEVVDNRVDAGGAGCVALSPDGVPWVAYAGADRQVRVATRRGVGDWVVDELSGLGRVGESVRVCLDIDSTGAPHVAYAGIGGDLLYGVKKGGQWKVEKVPTHIGLQRPGSVVHYGLRLHFRRDTPELQNTPHLVFHDVGTGSVGYARKVQLTNEPGASFKLVEIAHAAVPLFEMRAPSIAFDQSGVFRIAYVEARDSDLGAPPRLHRVWTNLILDPLEATMAEPKMLAQGNFNVIRQTAVTSDTGFCAAYHDGTNNKLMAHFTVAGSAEAVAMSLADTPNAVSPSVSRTSRGRYRIAFDDRDGLKLARQVNDGRWEVDLVDAAATTGASPGLVYEKIALTAHLGYTVGATLKYARWTEQP